MKELVNIIQRKWMRLRLQPISVFCFHQVSDVFDPESMWECDWMSTNDFKNLINNLQKKYTFISLQDAYDKLKHNTFRFRKYAVLTADDGWASVMNVIPWLSERQIPITLFLNPLYLDGVHKQEREAEQLLTKRDLEKLQGVYPNITVASHGWTHKDTTKLNTEEFLDSIKKSEQVLNEYTLKKPFYAFTYGRYKNEYIDILRQHHLVPVLIDGNKNIKFDGAIHREEIEKAI